MEHTTDKNSPTSGSGQSTSQPSRLCQACLSVLKRDGLELETYYPHHSTLRAFIEASKIRCYVCSWILSQVPENDQRILERLAQGKAPDYMTVEEDENTDTGVSDPRAKLRDCLRDRFGAWDESVSWDSFTAMEIRPWVGSQDCRRISVYLNPSHEGYFPLDTRVHDTFLSNYWKALAFKCVWRDKLFVASHEGN